MIWNTYLAPRTGQLILQAVHIPTLAAVQGENIPDEWNAIHVADTPTTDALKKVPRRWRTIKAHGTAVGLPSDADMGNSEVRSPALRVRVAGPPRQGILVPVSNQTSLPRIITLVPPEYICHSHNY